MSRRSIALLSGALLLTGALAGCGESGSSGTKAEPKTSEAPADAKKASCDPIAGDQLVVLEDDKQLQTVDNLIPAINAEVATDPMIEALNAVSAALTTDDLIALNQQTDLERKTSPNVAQEYAQSSGLTEGLSGGSGEVVIGAFNFSESQTVANLYAEALNAAGFDASVKTVGNREVVEPA